MRTVKIGELKAKLSAHIDYVKKGEDVLIFDRNTPVARIVPAGPLDDCDEQEQRLIASGVLIPPRKARHRFKPVPAGSRPMSREAVDLLWEEERADRS